MNLTVSSLVIAILKSYYRFDDGILVFFRLLPIAMIIPIISVIIAAIINLRIKPNSQRLKFRDFVTVYLISFIVRIAILSLMKISITVSISILDDFVIIPLIIEHIIMEILSVFAEAKLYKKLLINDKISGIKISIITRVIMILVCVFIALAFGVFDLIQIMWF